jgi:hypothetical protein
MDVIERALDGKGRAIETDDERRARHARLAKALGWPGVPQITPEEKRRFDAMRAEANARAQRFWGLDDDAQESSP